MPTYELSTIPLEEHKDRFPIEALEQLIHLPTTANTPDELRGILDETDALTILAGVAIANTLPEEDRFAGPAIFGGHPNYFRKFARDESGKLMRVDEAGFGVAVSGIFKVFKDKNIFIPRTLNVSGNDGPDRPDGLRYGLVAPIVGPYNYDPNQYISAVFANGITPIYNSNWPVGEIKSPIHGLSKQSHRFENRPSAVLECIKEVAFRFVEREVLRELHIEPVLDTGREKIAV